MVYTGQQCVGVDPDREHEKLETSLAWQLFCDIETVRYDNFGMDPTECVEAKMARGNFLLPEDISLTIPTGRFILPGGSIFLEGVGVQPTLRILIDAETVLSDEDLVLQAVEFILRQTWRGDFLIRRNNCGHNSM